MHPPQFVNEMVMKGRKAEIIQMLFDFNDNLQLKKTREHATAYELVSMFIVSVASQLREVHNVEDMENDEFLFVWKSLGMYGIDRTEIDKVIKSDD